MVKTRSLLRKEQAQMEMEEQGPLPNQQLVPNTEPNGKKSDEKVDFNRTFLNAGSVVKSEPPLKTVPPLPATFHHRSEKTNSRKSLRTSSSVAAQRAKLVLEAAEAKAKIQMDLIDKKLAAEIADLEEGCSIRSDKHTNSDVEKWLERSQQELEAQIAPEHGHRKPSEQRMPEQNYTGNDEGTETVRLLASALKDLTTASATNGTNSSLLSRICTPRDLPPFAGEPMEWLHFKQAYEESSLVCKFISKENLWRLRKCLRGPAREAVSALLISATTPEMVMSTLELQFSIPKDTLGDAAVRFKTGQLDHEGDRTLGLIWLPQTDVLKIDISLKRIPECYITGKEIPTKRMILRIVMSIFDVYGFLSPIIIIGKIILQECWQTNISWDERIPNNICTKWYNWINLLTSLRNIYLPRHYEAARMSENETAHNLIRTRRRRDALAAAAAVERPDAPVLETCSDTAPGYTNLQLHIFCDASTKAMCAVGYWRWIDNNTGDVFVVFVASKCRVAPVKATTVPRLELQASVIAARLSDTIINEHRIKPTKRFLWCDSTTVLHWIKNSTKNYKTFVAHRLGEIDELTKPDEWRYIPTHMNIADVATRDNCDIATLKNEWLYGPTFLRSREDTWPTIELQPEKDLNKLECISVMHEKEIFSIPEPKRFSSWLRLKRAMFVVLQFINKLSKKHTDDHSLMKKAEIFLLRYSQACSFGDEINKLRKTENLPKSSRLLTLSPFLDEHGVLRAEGRISAAVEVGPETKKPIILDGSEYITRLIVRTYHVAAAHANREMVVNDLKQKYWIIKLRPTVRNIASKCMFCRIKKCKPEIPRIGDLPEARMAHHHRPFTFCGVDLFGPLEVTIGRRREKRYGVLFTCLTVRAIHLELVTTLTTDSLIMALRRMASRRGWPQQMFSDNGTNLRGADTELRRSCDQIDEIALQTDALNRGIKWNFIPPASPHWGGAWERLIRSVKTSLSVVLKERAPREETLITLLAEIENMVNGRPLTHVTVEPGGTESLTPNHFLIGSSSNLPRIGVFDDTDTYLRKQWRLSQRLADMFWQRWLREVLPEMIPRKKWHNEERPLKVGDLVILVDPNNPRNVWPRGRIEEVLPGKDKRVRMVKIRTKSGVLARSATRVMRIPIGDECC